MNESGNPGRRGLFVVFEGGDGTGKSTQVRELTSWLTQRGIAHRLTHEPGDSWLGQQVRRLVLSNDSGPIGPRAEALLYMADKAQHVDEVVEPALARGEVVVCDRYVDSTIAYQGAGRQVLASEIEQVARWATRDLRPDLTVLLDLDPSQAVGTIAEPDRLESAGAEFHERVRQGFLELAARDPEHYLVLGAREARPAIARAIRARVAALLGLEVVDQSAVGHDHCAQPHPGAGLSGLAGRVSDVQDETSGERD